MLYDITLRIAYDFGPNSASGRQILRVLPKELPRRQRVVASMLDLRPRPSERVSGVDFFGNPTVEAAYLDVWKSIECVVQARVSRLSDPPELDFSPDLARLADQVERYRRLDPQSPHHFTGPSPRIQPDAAIEAFALSLLAPGTTALEFVRRLNDALFSEIRFDAEATNVNTPASIAFAHRHGVCQDFAHIMITALRAVGIPAGYVSGFLRTIPPEGQARLEGADAMHAWVSTWCGEEQGWVEFDPTNGIAVGNDHVLVATGRDYGDVAPVSGVLRTAGTQETRQAVDMVAL